MHQLAGSKLIFVPVAWPWNGVIQ